MTVGPGRVGSGRFIFLIDLKLKNKMKCVYKIVLGALLKILCGFLDLPYMTEKLACARNYNPALARVSPIGGRSFKFIFSNFDQNNDQICFYRS